MFECKCEKSQYDKLTISIISALVFFIVANPETFKLVRRVIGSWVATPTGCPSMTGLVLHAAVFMLVVWGMMNIKKEKMEGEEVVMEEEMMVEEPMPEPEPMMEPVVRTPPNEMSKLLGMDMDMADAMESGTYKTCGCSDGSRVVIMN
tara:strand:- start:1377 stop:1820 length:444 start_codon:yes stop_codon:yes gene_type:complete